MAVEPTTYADVNVEEGYMNYVAPQVGLGNKFSKMSTNQAAMRYSDVSDFESSLHSQRLKDLENMAAAIHVGFLTASPPVTVSAGAIIAALASLVHIPIPEGSSNVRISAAPPEPPT